MLQAITAELIGLPIIGTLVFIIYKNISKRVDNCQTKEMCSTIKSAIGKEISLRFEETEKRMMAELKHIREIVECLKTTEGK